MQPSLESKILPFLAEKSGVHAVMFYGSEEDAIAEAATLLANAWLCLSPEGGLPCHKCAACGAYERGNLIDFKEIFPKGPSNLIRIAAITYRPPESGEEPVQSLQEFLWSQPVRCKRKVVIIHQADRLLQGAANALLKILEEPHPYAKLILTTTALGEVLPTIRSRCSSVPISSTGEKNLSAGEIEVEQIARDAMNGKPSEALKLAERLRDASESFQGEGGARAAYAAVLRSFAQALQQLAPDRPEWTQAAIETHRRILGNASAGLQFDALLTRIVRR